MLKLADIQRYEDIVRRSTDAKILLKSAAQSSHCIILQSEDKLLADLLAYIYIKEVLGGKDDLLAKRLADDNIPDIITLPRGEKFLTEDAEFIADTAYLTPSEFDYKIYVINNSETMTDHAQNKLLKLFEEPPKSCRFILKCSSKFSLLPTVRSRSEVVEVRPLDNDAVLAALPQTVTDRQRRLIEATCFGRPDYAEKVLSDGNYAVAEDLVFEIFSQMKRSSELAKFAFLTLKLKDYIEIIIFYIECVLHDCAVYGIKKETVYFKHREKEIAAIAVEYPEGAALELSDRIMRARQRIKGYGSVTGIVDELLFSMLEVKTKWQKL